MITIRARVTDLDSSLAFYRKLNFEVSDTQTASGLCVADRGVIIELTTEAKARTSLIWYQEMAVLADEKPILDPDGNKLIFRNEPAPIFAKKPSLLGVSSGICLECLDLASSVNFYKELGLNILMGSIEQGWLSLGLEETTLLSLMSWGSCPHLFLNPSICYFNGEKNLSVIEQLRALEVPIKEELKIFNTEGDVDNVIIEAPGNIGVFVFND